MRSLRYLHLDVFTDRPFTGNQLAVFPDPGPLSTSQMQSIAGEMAFSETTFIYPGTGSGDVGMRIFTPGSELPIAGHPTIGSTVALALEGVIGSGREQFTFELGVGPTPVSLEWTDGQLAFVWMTQPRPEFGPSMTELASVARAIGVEDSAIRGDVPVQRVSCGVPYVLVPMTSRAAVDRVSVERNAFARCCAEAGMPETPGFFFTTEGAASPEETAYSRMIAPSFGIAEDPATGSASGPLGSYLLEYGLVSSPAAASMISLQGVAMGRPSRIHMSIEGEPGRITRVRVGGQAVLVGRGELSGRPD